MAEETYTGSCLCGALRYEVHGEPGNFMLCHCSRCRKSTGSGNASNLFVISDSVQWEGDESLYRSFNLPEAKRFGRSFCTNCGGPLPSYIPQANVAMIPAGTLDQDIEAKPTARIFCDSRVSWSKNEGTPEFDQYPTKS